MLSKICQQSYIYVMCTFRSLLITNNYVKELSNRKELLKNEKKGYIKS